VHPRDAKMRLAYTFVRMFHGESAAEEAERRFVTVFQQRSLPEDIAETPLSATKLEGGTIRLINLLVELGLQSSNSEAKRSIAQGAVKINEQKRTDPYEAIAVADGDIVQVGKRKFAKIKLVP